MAIPTSFEQVTSNSVDGAQMGKGVLEKNAFFGSTPVIQPTSGDQAAVSATAAAAALTSAATETQASSSLTVTNALNTIASVNGSGATSTQEGEIDTLFAQIKTDLDANKVVVDRLVVESTDYKVSIDANVVDVAAQKVELDKLITDVASLITLGNQVRSELVTLGLIKGS